MQQRLIVRTVNSVYEVLMWSRRFRRVAGQPKGAVPLAEWRSFHRLGPLARGRPMRLWWSRSESGRVVDLDVLTTAPVLDISVTLETGGDRADAESPEPPADSPRRRPTLPMHRGDDTLQPPAHPSV